MALAACLSNHAFKACLWHPSLSSVRTARYPAWYLTPVADEEEFKRLKDDGTLQKLRLVPVKPAPSTVNVSVFDDKVLNRFISIAMKWGHRQVFTDLMFLSFARIKRIQLKKYHSASEEEKNQIELNPRKVFHTAVLNCSPVLELLPVKRGGITYQVPTPLSHKKSEFMAMKWLITASYDKEGEISLVEQLSRELLDAFNNEGRVVRRKQEIHRICEANKAYAHYRWS